MTTIARRFSVCFPIAIPPHVLHAALILIYHDSLRSPDTNYCISSHTIFEPPFLRARRTCSSFTGRFCTSCHDLLPRLVISAFHGTSSSFGSCRSFNRCLHCNSIRIHFFVFTASMSISAIPPPLPPLSIYTPNYCEENVYLLAKHFLENPAVNGSWTVHAIFISNPSKSVRTPTHLFCSVPRVHYHHGMLTYHIHININPLKSACPAHSNGLTVYPSQRSRCGTRSSGTQLLCGTIMSFWRSSLGSEHFAGRKKELL